MMNMDDNSIGAMMFGMGLIGILILVAIVLVVAAAIKILFFDRDKNGR